MIESRPSPAFLAIRRQFEFAGTAAARRLDRLESLVADVVPDATYPVDWLVFRVTGVTPEASSQPDVVTGSQLLPELVTLVEEIDRRLGPAPIDPERQLDAEEAARRLGVSRRTIQRWRPLGLPMRRVRHSDGTIRAAVRSELLQRFAARHGAKVGRAGRRRLSDEAERVRIREAFEREIALGTSPAEAARTVATRFGRSVDMVRSTCGREGAGREDRLDRATMVRTTIRARRRQVSRAEIAARCDRSAETIRRIELTARWIAIRDLEPGRIEVPNRDRDDAAEVFGAAGELDDLARRLHRTGPSERLEIVRGLPGIEDESIVEARIAAMHYARSLALDGVARLRADGRETPSERDIDPIEASLRWWGLLLERNTISALASGLLRFEQSAGRRVEELPRRRSEEAFRFVLGATAASVKEFDPSRRVEGHELSRAVGLGVARRVAATDLAAGTSSGARRRVAGDPMELPDTLEVVPPTIRRLLDVERWWRRLDDPDLAGFGGEDIGPRAMRARMSLDGTGRPLSMRETGRRLGLPPTRFAGDLESAQRRLRAVAIRGLPAPPRS